MLDRHNLLACASLPDRCAGASWWPPTPAPPGRPPTGCARPCSTRSTSLDAIVDARVADLFAGSGALGIEALSRGAAHCTFVERDRDALSAIHANIGALGLAGVARVVGGRRRRVRRRAIEADIAFVDPPYDFDALGRPAGDDRRAVRGRRVGREVRGAGGMGADRRQALWPDLGDVPRTATELTRPERHGRAPMGEQLVPRTGVLFRPLHDDGAVPRKLRPDPPRPPRRHRAVGRAVHLPRRRGVVVVAVMHNHDKPGGMFTVDERVRLIARAWPSRPRRPGPGRRPTAASPSTPPATAGARFIVQGLRNAGDFEIEQQMALTNYSVTGIRTVYLPCGTDRGFISSRFVREIALYGGAIDHLVPGPVAAALSARFPRRTRPPQAATDERRRPAVLRRLRRHRRRVPRPRRRGRTSATPRRCCVARSTSSPRRPRCRCRRRRASTATRSSSCSRRRCRACPTSCARRAGC